MPEWVVWVIGVVIVAIVWGAMVLSAVDARLQRQIDASRRKTDAEFQDLYAWLQDHGEGKP